MIGQRQDSAEDAECGFYAGWVDSRRTDDSPDRYVERGSPGSPRPGTGKGHLMIGQDQGMGLDIRLDDKEL